VQGAAPAVGDVYFVNTLGSSAGAFMAGFVLLPSLGLRGTASLAIAINLAAAAAVLAWRGHERTPLRVGLALVPAALALLVCLRPPDFDTKPLTAGAYVGANVFGDLPDASLLEGVAPEEIAYYRDGLSATVSVHHMRGQWALHLNGKADASTGQDMATQVLVAQAAMLFGKPPRDVLVIGWASGVTVGSAARNALERLDAVELEPAMLEASRFFEHVNGRPLDDPRVHVVLDDGRNYVETTRRKYDVIISEPSNPWITGIANLFTREFFRAAHAALAPEGRFITWFPMYGIDPEALRSIVASLHAEFPHIYALVLDRNVPDLMLLATARPLTPEDLPRWESLSPALQSDLYRIGTHSTSDLWSLLRLMPEDVAALVGDSPVQNGDDNLFVELRTPWLLYADHFAPDGEGPSARAWQQIDTAPFSANPLFQRALALPGAPRAGELALSYLNVRHDSAATAHVAALASDSGEVAAARAQIERASGSLDSDGYAAALERAVALEPRSYDLRMLRAKRHLAANDAAAALDDVGVALAERPGDPAALGVRASALLRVSRVEEARAALAEVEKTEYWLMSRQLWLLAGIAALGVGEIDEGVRRVEQYLEAEPGAAQAWQLLERAYTELGRTADAARARRNEAMNLYLIAIAAEKQGDMPRALETLQRALAVQPDHVLARQALARLGG
jgi:spermidine synthase/tetratricopeptide (TPR) repeat protein